MRMRVLYLVAASTLGAGLTAGLTGGIASAAAQPQPPASCLAQLIPNWGPPQAGAAGQGGISFYATYDPTTCLEFFSSP